MWDPFLMIKNEICGSMNSAYMHCSLQKVNICGYCSLNSNRNTPKRVRKKKKKGTKRSLETQTWNPNTHILLLFYMLWQVIVNLSAVISFFLLLVLYE